jgi:hypothetical protein
MTGVAAAPDAPGDGGSGGGDCGSRKGSAIGYVKSNPGKIREWSERAARV